MPLLQRGVHRLQRIMSLPTDKTTRPHRNVRFAIIAAVSLAAPFPLPAYPEPVSAAVTQMADRWQSYIDEAAARFNVPASWIRAVIRAESKGDPKAVSPKGAIGLMQLMPHTYAQLRIRFGLGDDPTDPHDNIIAGTAYLRDLYERFGPAGFIAAYNAGPQRYEDHLATGRPLPDETLAYVAELTRLLVDRFSVNDRIVANDRASRQQSFSLFVAQLSSQSTAGYSLFAHNERAAALSTLVPLSGGLFVHT